MDWSKRTGVKWSRRDYDVEDFESSDDINQALSAANACLYGVVHAAVVALGCSPGLGIVHTGHDRSFVYDIADLYKAETSIPVAFETVAMLREAGGERTHETDDSLGSVVRRRMRDRMMESRLLERIVSDVKGLLGSEDDVRTLKQVYIREETGRNLLWDSRGEVEGGVNYSGEEGP